MDLLLNQQLNRLEELKNKRLNLTQQLELVSVEIEITQNAISTIKNRVNIVEEDVVPLNEILEDKIDEMSLETTPEPVEEVFDILNVSALEIPQIPIVDYAFNYGYALGELVPRDMSRAMVFSVFESNGYVRSKSAPREFGKQFTGLWIHRDRINQYSHLKYVALDGQYFESEKTHFLK